MSDLQIILIIVGGFIIAAVVAYNYMQERKLRNKITRDFIVPQKDVLTDDFYIDADAYIDKELPEASDKFRTNKVKKADAKLKQESVSPTQFIPAENKSDPEEQVDDNEIIEPISDFKSAVSQPEIQPSNSDFSSITKIYTQKSPQISADLIENSADNLKKTPFKAPATLQKPEIQVPNLPQNLHPQIDLTAVLFANQPISTTTLNSLASELADISQLMTLYALDNDDKWQLLTQVTPERLFKQVSCSIQLADRGGPIAKHLLNKFQFAVENMGSELSAHVEWQGANDAMQRAVELDQFCIEVDQLISVHLIQNDNPIHGTKFKGIAEANGLSLNNDGKFYFYGNLGDMPLFSIIDTSNQAFTLDNLRQNVFKSLTFQLEIPKVTNSEQVFNQMIIMAQKMANSLNANLVDDNLKPLGDLQVEKIRQQLKIIHAKMVARSIMPGSPSALRLFN